MVQVQSLARELRSLKPQETTTKENNKIVRKKNGKKFQDTGLGKQSLDLTPKVQSINGKTDKYDFIKIKNFYCEKDPIRRMKR